MLNLRKNHPKKFVAVATSVVTMGFLEAMVNDWADDDDEYYLLNDYVRELFCNETILGQRR